MKILSNAHTHTTYCDGANSPEEMIRAALDCGFVSLGFSVHAWTPHEPCGITVEKEALYREELRQLREKYRGQIEIIIGVEGEGIYPRDFSEFEYYLDSAHWFEKDGEFMCVDWSEERMLDYVHRLFGGDFYAYCKAYYETAAQMCARSKALYIGHIDLLTKFNEGGKHFDETDPRYLGPAMEAVKCAVERGLPLEMNTGAISRGYRVTPYPSIPLLKYIRSLGGEIMINSDAHAAKGIATGFDLCEQLALEAGFDHVLRLRESGLEEAGLR